MRLKPYLQLVRLPNVFTAGADSLAGWLLVGGALSDAGGWLPLVAASASLYAGGIALNDVCDEAIDGKERPDRPLPSGQVSRRFALGLGGLLLVAGPALAGLSGALPSVLAALALAACVLLYDLGAKRTVFGPEVMGACRGLNLLLGMSHAPAFGGPAAWLTAGSYALFVVGVTWISRTETESGRTRGLYAGMVLEDLAIVGLLAAALQPGRFPAPAPAPDRPIIALEGLLVLLLVARVVNLAGARALRQPVPRLSQRAVKTGVLALVWLNVGVVAAVRGPLPALSVAAFWVPAVLLGRWLYAT